MTESFREADDLLCACEVSGVDPRVLAPTLELPRAYTFLVARGLVSAEKVTELACEAHVQRQLFCAVAAVASFFPNKEPHAAPLA